MKAKKSESEDFIKLQSVEEVFPGFHHSRN